MTRARKRSGVELVPIADASVAFDYTALDPAGASELHELAGYVRAGVRCAGTAMIEIGWALLEAKARLPHGAFGRWLAAEFQWTERTASNYMTAAKAFGDKTEIVSDLPAATIYRLAAPSTPEPVRAEVVRRLEAGEDLHAGVIDQMVVIARREAANRDQRRDQRAARQVRKAEHLSPVSAPVAVDRQALLEACSAARRRAAELIVERMGALAAQNLILLLEEADTCGALQADIAAAAKLDFGPYAAWRESAAARLNGAEPNTAPAVRATDAIGDEEPDLPPFLDRRTQHETI